MSNTALMHSGYARIANDDYKTIDPRCTYALLQHFRPRLAVDVCAPSGSGIVDTLQACGVEAFGAPDAFADDIFSDWIVSNPPYTRGLVDKIIWRQLDRLRAGDVNAVAMLMRWGFDHALTRTKMFAENPLYFGQIKTLFRPQWVEKRPGDKQPFHPFVWHIFMKRLRDWPVVMYSDGEKPLFYKQELM